MALQSGTVGGAIVARQEFACRHHVLSRRDSDVVGRIYGAGESSV